MEKVAELRVRGIAATELVHILAKNGYSTEVYTGAIPLTARIDVERIEHIVRVYRPKEEGQ